MQMNLGHKDWPCVSAVVCQATTSVNNCVSSFTKASSLLSLFPFESCAFSSFPSLTSGAPSGNVIVQQAAARQRLAKSGQDTWMVANQRGDHKQPKKSIKKQDCLNVYIMSIDYRHYSRFRLDLHFVSHSVFDHWSGATDRRQHGELCMSLYRFKDKGKRHARCVRCGTDAGHVPLKGAMIPPRRNVGSHVVKATFEARPAKIWAKAT